MKYALLLSFALNANAVEFSFAKNGNQNVLKDYSLKYDVNPGTLAPAACSTGTWRETEFTGFSYTDFIVHGIYGSSATYSIDVSSSDTAACNTAGAPCATGSWFNLASLTVAPSVYAVLSSTQGLAGQNIPLGHQYVRSKVCSGCAGGTVEGAANSCCRGTGTGECYTDLRERLVTRQ